MNKSDLINAISDKAPGVSKKDVETVINAFVAAVQNGLQSGESITIPGFGTFSVGDRAARTGMNPRTKETIEIAATKVVKFKPGKTLKDAVAA